MDKLITLAKQGDSDALAQIMSLYKNLIHSVANRYYLVGGDKEDLLQECMLGVFSAVCTYDQDKGAFPAFVKMCVVRRVLGVVKRDNNLSNKPLSHYVSLATIGRDYASDPLDMLIDKEMVTNLRQAIDIKLTARERDVLMLFLDGFTYKDISSRLSLTYKAVDSAMQRAKKKLAIDKE